MRAVTRGRAAHTALTPAPLPHTGEGSPPWRPERQQTALPRQFRKEASMQREPRRHNGYVWAISLVAAMGGLLFGYDWVVIGGAKPFFERYFELQTRRCQGLGQQLRPDRLPGRRARSPAA